MRIFYSSNEPSLFIALAFLDSTLVFVTTPSSLDSTPLSSPTALGIRSILIVASLPYGNTPLFDFGNYQLIMCCLLLELGMTKKHFGAFLPKRCVSNPWCLCFYSIFLCFLSLFNSLSYHDFVLFMLIKWTLKIYKGGSV